jgi:hypothetical protein
MPLGISSVIKFD